MWSYIGAVFVMFGMGVMFAAVGTLDLGSEYTVWSDRLLMITSIVGLCTFVIGCLLMRRG